LGKAEAEKIFTKFPNFFPKKRNRFPALIRPENLILRGGQAPSFLIGPGAPLPSKQKIVGRRSGHGERLRNHSPPNSLEGNAFLPDEDPEARCRSAGQKKLSDIIGLKLKKGMTKYML